MQVRESIHPVHEAQLLTYLRLSAREVGLLINFNVPVLKQGIRRKLLAPEPSVASRIDSVQAADVACDPSGDLDDPLSRAVIGAAIEVHRHLAPVCFVVLTRNACAMSCLSEELPSVASTL